MGKIIDISAHKHKLIRHVGPTQPPVDPAEVARALGAEPAPVTFEGVLGPITLFAVRQELFKRLESSGGRPALARRAKVPLSDAEWRQLEELAGSVGSAGFAPSAGQVASVLLSAALRQVASEAGAGQPNSPLARELAERAAGVAGEDESE